jgi:hypothetical protein
VFENRVLRRIFVPKWDEVTGESRKLHNEELHNLYSSPNLGTSNQGGWDGPGMWHARERRENRTRFCRECPKERDHSEDRGVDERMGLQ